MTFDYHGRNAVTFVPVTLALMTFINAAVLLVTFFPKTF